MCGSPPPPPLCCLNISSWKSSDIPQVKIKKKKWPRHGWWLSIVCMCVWHYAEMSNCCKAITYSFCCLLHMHSACGKSIRTQLFKYCEDRRHTSGQISESTKRDRGFVGDSTVFIPIRLPDMLAAIHHRSEIHTNTHYLICLFYLHFTFSCLFLGIHSIGTLFPSGAHRSAVFRPGYKINAITLTKL